MQIEELANFGMPEKVINVLKEAGLKELYPPQADAIENGLLDLDSSFVISVPTASGKTLISELLAIKSFLERGGKCLYTVPLKALAFEKLEDFKKYESIGIRSAISTGDYDTTDSWLANETAIAGQPKNRASIAAATVPEYSTSSPRFAPALIPQRTISGSFSSKPVIARCIQSVGVPLT